MSDIDGTTMPEMRLEVVPLPISDVERTKAFYVEQVGFHLDHDVTVSETMRVIQLTPPGSACSVVFGVGLGVTDQPPGSVKGLHLVVKDVRQVRAILAERGVEVSDVVDMGGILYVFFSDPDGNSWALQEIPPGRG
jgi:catechol 2,3-dioxygenase-like lactoylglutathione lyase family enzyme